MTVGDSQLPNGWRWEALSKLVEPDAPILYGILQPGPRQSEGVSYVRPTEIVDDVIDLSAVRRTTSEIAARYKRSILRINDVILSIVGTIGKVALVPAELEGANITQSSVRIRPRKTLVEPKFLALALRSPVIRSQYDRLRLGSAVPRLNVAHVRDLRVPLAPYNEQQRIVAEIEKQFTRLDAGMASLNRVGANAKRYGKAVRLEAVTGRLSRTEQKWPLAKVEEIAETIVDCAHSTPKFVDRGAPCIDTTCIKPGRVLAARLRFVDADTYKRRVARLIPKPRDVVFAREGTVGTAVMIPDGMHPCLGQRVMLIRAGKLMDSRFLELCLNSELVRQQYLPKILGTTAPHLNVRDVKALLLPVPPIGEQRRLAQEVESLLSTVFETEHIVETNLKRARNLRQSILQRAFSGQL